MRTVSSGRRVRTWGFVATAMLLAVTFAAVPAAALPRNTPASTLGTNGPVRALLQVGNVMWLGGRFTALTDGTPVSGLAALDVRSGRKAAGVRPPVLSGAAFVYDLTAHGNTVYAAGSFGASNGARNLVAFNGRTGALVKRFKAPTLKSVLFHGGRILAGGGKLRAFLPNGKRDRTWAVTDAKIDTSLRGHNTVGEFRDIQPGRGGRYFVACQCDWVLNPEDSTGPSTRTKAIVKLNANGSVHRGWAPAGLPANSAAFGINLYMDSDGVVLAAGGSDFTAKYSMRTGAKIFYTDTNGSSQAVTRYDDSYGSHYIVGGHYRCVATVFHPRLAALSLIGALVRSWTVAPTPQYNGVWVETVDTHGHLWIGGEFRKLGTGWVASTCDDVEPVSTGSVSQPFVARFD
jgi:hypothetical protein